MDPINQAVAPVDAVHSLDPLPSLVHRGLLAITVLGFLSFVATFALLVHLTFRLLTWEHRAYARINQYVALLLNLLLADLQQAVGFALNLSWLHQNSIVAPSATCWTQGWFLNAGDVGSAVFTLAMACHLFADIVFDYRLDYVPFLLTILGLWCFNYLCATIGIVLHPQDFYMRAGMWCWIQENYMSERLWLHYVWIITAEFGMVLIYMLMFIVLWKRVRGFFYVSSDHQFRAESAARSVLLYPVVYMICTLPAVIARISLMAGREVGYLEYTVVGAMMTSNGWLDVVIYLLTRKSLIFGPAIANRDVHGLDTFTPWSQYRSGETPPDGDASDIKFDSNADRAYSSHGRSDSSERIFQGEWHVDQGQMVRSDSHHCDSPQCDGRQCVQLNHQSSMQFPRRKDPCTAVRDANPMMFPRRKDPCTAARQSPDADESSTTAPMPFPRRKDPCTAVRDANPMMFPRRKDPCTGVRQSSDADEDSANAPMQFPRRKDPCTAVRDANPMMFPRRKDPCTGVRQSSDADEDSANAPMQFPRRKDPCTAVRDANPMMFPRRKDPCTAVRDLDDGSSGAGAPMQFPRRKDPCTAVRDLNDGNSGASAPMQFPRRKDPCTAVRDLNDGTSSGSAPMQFPRRKDPCTAVRDLDDGSSGAAAPMHFPRRKDPCTAVRDASHDASHDSAPNDGNSPMQFPRRKDPCTAVRDANPMMFPRRKDPCTAVRDAIQDASHNDTHEGNSGANAPMHFPRRKDPCTAVRDAAAHESSHDGNSAAPMHFPRRKDPCTAVRDAAAPEPSHDNSSTANAPMHFPRRKDPCTAVRDASQSPDSNPAAPMHFPRRKDPCTAVREAIDRAADQAAAAVEKEKEKEDENEKEKEKEQGHPARTSDERPMSSADDDMQIERCVSAGLGH